jgi:hypothetical protein
MKHKHFLFAIATTIAAPFFGFAQDEEQADTTAYVEIEDSPLVTNTFESTRIINGHSVENLRKGVLEFRVEHKFGDIAGADGGIQSMYGLDNSSDIRLAFEYGVTDKLMVGFGRSKGAGTPYKSLLDGFVKYRLLQQSRTGMPVSMSLLGTMSYSYQKASSDLSQVSSYPKQVYRMAYCAQLNIARKFGNSFSLAVLPTVVHRNYVNSDDQNTIFALGSGMHWSITSKYGILLEYYHCLASSDVRNTVNANGANKYQNSLSVAFEWITFGHNFTIYVTNSKGFGETQFITNTQESWLKGQFRLGFCVGRKFEKE